MDETSMNIELEGTIYLTELDKDGKVLKREPLDGEVCLKALLHVLEQSLDHLEKESPEIKNEEEP